MIRTWCARPGPGALLAAVLWLLANQAMAQRVLPAQAASDDDDSAQREARKKDRERAERGMEQAAPQAVGDAPLPPQGQPTPKPIVTRGPLTIRRSELSLGFDHALSRQWVASGLLGSSRGRLHRFQTELPPDALPGSPPQTSDSHIRTRSTSVTGVLSYLPQPDTFYDVALSAMRTGFDVERNVNDAALFAGRNVGRSWSLGVNAARVWQQAGRSVVPQVGLEYTQSDVDPLKTDYRFFNDPARFEGFTVGRQHSRTLAALAGAQVQWPRSAGFGVWAPYARATLRQRLWMRGEPIVATAVGANPIVTDPQTITPRTAGTLAGGMLVQWPRGIGAFAELGFTRANGDVRESRVGAGLKFEF